MKRAVFLLLDSRVVAKTRNAKLTVGKAVKHRDNPLFAEDRPWEARFDNLYANVIHDSEEKLYKCWYSPFIVDDAGPKPAIVNRDWRLYRPRRREMGVCYAVSADGLKWRKPKLGLVEFNGSKANNLVARGPHGAGVFKDLADPDPRRRYKMLFKGELISVAFSSDGLRWGKGIECPEGDAPGDTHNNAFLAPTLGRYVGITRTWSEPRGRQVARMTSRDFIRWSRPRVVLEGIENRLQTYSMPVSCYEGVYIGLPSIYDAVADRTHTELAWSPDTIAWHRIDPGTPLIPTSESYGACDWGCVYAAANPVIRENEIRLYYGCSDGRHSGWRNGFLCLATLGPDGWAGYEQRSAAAPAFVVTAPLSCSGGAISLTADIRAGGFVKTRLLDGRGRELARARAVRATCTRGELEWPAGTRLTGLHGKPVRIEFEFRNATLYSLGFPDKD